MIWGHPMLLHGDGSGREWRPGEVDVVQRSDGAYAAWRYDPVSWRASPWVCVAVEDSRQAARAVALGHAS